MSTPRRPRSTPGPEPGPDPRILRLARLAAIGELAAGIAHEVNNPLNGIINCADILGGDRVEEAERREFAALILSEGERIARLLQALTAFASPDDNELSPTRLADLWERTAFLVGKYVRRANVRFNVRIPPDLPLVMCRPDQIQLVLITLLVGAVHALDERLPGEHPDKTLNLSAAPIARPPGVEIVVEDYGTVIAEIDAREVFEFQRIKGARFAAAAWGLQLCPEILRAHRGTIRVETGRIPTRFVVQLPAADL